MIFGPESRRAKRYAQRRILNMSAMERIMLSMACCEICKRAKRTPASVNMNALKNHWKNVYKWVHDEIQGWQRSLTTMQKLKQNKNVSQTIGESKNFESHIAAKSGIVKIQWKFVSFLTPQNRHVRATTGNVERAERCKLEEICLK